MSSIRKRLIVGTVAVVMATGLNIFGLGRVGELQAMVCGPYDGPMCWSNESCINIIFYKQCTTEYKYFGRVPPA